MIGFRKRNRGGSSPFPEESVQLGFAMSPEDVGTSLGFNVNSAANWNNYLNAYGSNTSFSRLEWGGDDELSILKLAGNLGSITEFVFGYSTVLVGIDITKLTNLITLEIPNQNLTEIDLTQNKSLERVNLQSCQFTEIPALPPLVEYLDVQSNPIPEITLTEEEHHWLAELNISGISTLLGVAPVISLNSTVLTKLHAGVNMLTDLSCIDHLPNLRFLAFSRNLLVEASFIHTPLIEILDLTICPNLAELDISILGQLQELIAHSCPQLYLVEGAPDVINIPLISINLSNCALDIFVVAEFINYIVSLNAHPTAVFLNTGTSASIIGDPELMAKYIELRNNGIEIRVNPYPIP